MQDMRLWVPLGLAIGMAGACFDPGTADCPVGQAGCECTQGDTCDGGLECIDGMCAGGNETVGDGDGDATGDGDGDTSGDGDGDTTGDGDGDTTSAENFPPVIESFTINGTDAPALVEQAGAIVIEAEASDDGEVVELRIEIDDVNYQTLEGAGPFVSDYAVGGTASNGTFNFKVVAVDDQGLETESVSISVGVSVTAGVVVDVWDWDGGGNDRSRSLWVDRDGTELIVVGDTAVQGQTRARIDRVIGPAWSEKVDALSTTAMAVVDLPEDGEYLVAAKDQAQTVLYRYDAGGVQVSVDADDWTPNAIPVEREEAPRQLHRDEDGNVYLLGTWDAAMLAPDPFYLTKFDSDFNILWQKWGDDANFTTFSNALKMDQRGDQLALAGWENFGMLSAFAWATRLDTQNGDFIEELTYPQGNLSFYYDVAIDDDGGRLFVGTERIDNQYTAFLEYTGAQQWAGPGNIPGGSHAIAVEYDDWGDFIVATLEGCQSTIGCQLHVTKYDTAGNEQWTTQMPGGSNFARQYEFEGAIKTDRFGYIYVTALHEGPNGDWDWWVAKVHP